MDKHSVSIQPEEIQKEYAERAKRGWDYTLFTSYIRFLHNHVYYRNVEILQKENIPTDGSLMIVCDHQNSLFDTLGLLMTVFKRNKRKVRIVSRGDMFQHPAAAKGLRWLGILPAFRLAIDGEEALKNNGPTFDEIEHELLNDGTVIIFPEAGEVPQRRLRTFSQGYLHILFEAAEKSGFTKEMFVLPSINHYSDYHAMQGDMLIKFGTPISLAPYYELYKTKPRTAKRQINALVRQQMSDMMLDIRDEAHYDSIDYLRNTYGIRYAKANGYDPADLHQKMLSDKELYTRLESEEDEAQHFYEQVEVIRNEAMEKGIGQQNVVRKHSGLSLLGRGLLLLVFLPLFMACLIPCLLVLIFPNLVASKIKEPILRIPVRVIAGVTAFIPVTLILIFSGMYIGFGSILLAVAAILVVPYSGVLSINYYRSFRNWQKDLRVFRLRKNGTLSVMVQSTRELHAELDQLLVSSAEKKSKPFKTIDDDPMDVSRIPVFQKP